MSRRSFLLALVAVPLAAGHVVRCVSDTQTFERAGGLVSVANLEGKIDALCATLRQQRESLQDLIDSRQE